MKPKHLEEYDLFAALKRWKDKASTTDTRRSWELRSYGKTALKNDLFYCRVSWSLDGQVAALDRVATSPEEAVSLVLAAFVECRREV